MEYSNLMRRTALAGGAFVVALAVDFVTKWMILNIVMVPPRTIELAPFFNLTLGFNTGVSFGMFRDLFLEHPLLLVGIKLVIVAGLLVWAMRTKSLFETVSFGLIAGGATGNVVDRIRQGAVTDFLDFHVGGWALAGLQHGRRDDLHRCLPVDCQLPFAEAIGTASSGAEKIGKPMTAHNFICCW